MSKKLGQGHVYYCVVSPLPLTIVKESKNWGDKYTER